MIHDHKRQSRINSKRAIEAIVVEMRRLELLTSNMQSWRSTN